MKDLTSNQEDAIFLLIHGERMKEAADLLDCNYHTLAVWLKRARQLCACYTNCEMCILFFLEYYGTETWTNLRQKWQPYIDQSRLVARVQYHVTSSPLGRLQEQMRK